MGNDAAPAKPIPLPNHSIMLKKLIYLSCLLSLTACENAPFKMAEIQCAAQLVTESSLLDSESISLIQRKKQQMVIESAFARLTTFERAKKLAAVCFEKTVGTVFMPFDLAEIALAETGGHRLSQRAVSSRGALGVWQLMPHRAKSHGYSPREMRDDEKCAEAAVLELYTKLEMAHGNMDRAKKLYCGQGPQADAYMKKIRHIRLEMISEFKRQSEKLAMADTAEGNL
jgi:hypothetical protein